MLKFNTSSYTSNHYCDQYNDCNCRNIDDIQEPNQAHLLTEIKTWTTMAWMNESLHGHTIWKGFLRRGFPALFWGVSLSDLDRELLSQQVGCIGNGLRICIRTIVGKYNKRVCVCVDGPLGPYICILQNKQLTGPFLHWGSCLGL